MEKIRLFLFGLCLCAAGSIHSIYAQSVLPIAGVSVNAIPASSTAIIVRSSPHSDYITLELAGDGKSVVPFEVYGLDGQAIYEGRISGTQLLEVSTWKSGTYFVVCGLQREKLIVNR